MGFWVLGGVCDGEIGARERRWRGLSRWGEGVTGGKTGGCVSDRVSEVSPWGEQLDRGAATLPTLSSLSRIDDDVRPIRIHERAGFAHMHTLPPPRTLSPASDLHRHDRPPPCHIYPQQCEGEGRLLLVSNKRATSEWEEAKHSPILPLQRPPTPPSLSLPCLTSNEVDKC